MSTDTERPDWATYSSLTLHRRCPQAWNYRYVQHLSSTPDGKPTVERDFGSWWHAVRAADAIERGRKEDTIRHTPETIGTVDDVPEIPTDDGEDLIGQVLAAAEHWWSHLSEERRDQYIGVLREAVPDRLMNLHERWTAQWADERSHEQPVAVEMKWKRPLPGTDLTLLGYIDEIYFDTKRHLTVVRDHKSAKTLSAANTADDLMDSQLHLYGWGAAEMLRGWNLPPVQAIGYDRVRMVAPREPKLTKAGRLSKTITDFDLDAYRAFCAEHPEHTPDEGLMSHLAAPAQRSTWYQRTLTPVNRNMIRAHLQAAIDSARETGDTVERVNRRGEAPRSLGKHCSWCDFSKLCLAQMMGGPEGEYDPETYGLRVDTPTR